MDDSFELEYADELDALDDFDPAKDVPDSYTQPKSKRSLKFPTPEEKKGKHCVDNSASDLPVQITERTDPTGGGRKRHPSIDDMLDEDEVDALLIDLPELEPSRKKTRLSNDAPKTQSEGDLMHAHMVEQIQQFRSLKNPSSNAVPVTENNLLSQQRRNDGEDTERRRVSKRIPNGDFISTVGHDGSRVFMKLWDEEVLESEYASLGSEARQTTLLPVPVCVMKENLDNEHSKRILQESEELHENLQRQLDEFDTEMVEPENTVDNTTNEPTDDRLTDLTESMKTLWVDKYAPKKYTELLSGEAINRTLLHWLKLWDHVVFDKELPKATKQGMNKKEKEKDQGKNKFRKFQNEVTDELDKHNRPEQKVALLCGPPGLGKTTLAHIVARHAGYNVVEMNASDDRSVEVFKNNLESATQMKALIGMDPRPNCLVIDEIDGAPAPAINVLLNTIKKTENDAASKKKSKGGLLLRPIICVCNDQYVPALRQLRQIALVLNFPQTESSKLAQRLKEVVHIEELKTDLNALLALCEKTDNDIRSCLNTLQFVRQKQKELTLRDVQFMSVGQKDTQKSLFSVWHEVFTMPRPKKNRFVSIRELELGQQDALKSNNNISPAARFQNILNVCSSAGEYDRVLQGLHENYLDAKSKDPHLSGLTLTNEWLCFADCNNQYTARSQDYSMMKYSCFLPVVFHFLYASHTPTRIQFPHKQSEAHQLLTKTKNLLATMISDMSPMVRKFTHPHIIVMDLLPSLLDILQPTLRPVNAQLYSAREKEELLNVVRIMIAYNMTYHQEKTLEGQYVYVLDPNVEEITKFPGMQQRRQLTYAAKQMIAREIDLEKMRRSESAVPQSLVPEATPTVPKKNPALPNHLQKLEAKALAPEKPSFNFFEKFTKTKREKPVSKKTDSEPKEDPSKKALLDTLIWFHFKEGYSNAVRRNVKVQDLL